MIMANIALNAVTEPCEKQFTMAYDQIELTAEFPIPPILFYQHWLSTEGHTLMTGAMAQVGPVEDTEYMARDGQISGKILELEPNKRILQTWRSSEFAATDKDSKLEVLLGSTEEGNTRVTLRQWDLPEGLKDNIEKMWEEKYFEPMETYFLST